MRGVCPFLQAKARTGFPALMEGESEKAKKENKLRAFTFFLSLFTCSVVKRSNAGDIMEHRFILEKEHVVVDSQTGLMWQRGASVARTVWKEGFQYIEKLNSESFAGYADWRYPTEDELAGLIAPEEDRLSGLYIDPIFENQRSCWSSSRREGHRHEACYADFYYGDMYLVEENYANLFVRAVRNRNTD